MNFKIKTFSAAIGILLCALALNSVLSISFFENIYAQSLTSILESAGKNLQQKIERGIRLGKPLEAYEGMSDTLDDFLADNTRASSVAVSNAAGDILYRADTGKPKRNLLSGHARENLPGTDTVTRLRGDSYLLYIPIIHRADVPAGAVLVSVSRQEVRDKIRDMAIGTLVRLGWTLGPTALLLVLILGLFVVRPIKTDLKRIRHRLSPYMGLSPESRQSSRRTENGAGAPRNMHEDRYAGDDIPAGRLDPLRDDDFRQVKNEIKQLGVFIEAVAVEIHADIRHSRDMERSIPELEEIKTALQSCNAALSGLYDNPDVAALKHELKALLAENDQILRLTEALLHEKRTSPVTDGHRNESVAGAAGTGKEKP